MTENEPMVKGDWQKYANENIVKNLVKKIEELLGGEAKHYYVSDRTTKHEKIVIEYNHETK